MRWLDISGDPREHYLPHVEWSPDGSQLLVQQLNRLQNAHRVMLADPKTGATRTIHTETDAAWVENENPVQWLNGGKDFLWLSERDGWRHAYVAGTDGPRFTRVTPGDFDVIDSEAVDTAGGWFYYAASPTNPTQRYLYRSRLPAARPSAFLRLLSPAGTRIIFLRTRSGRSTRIQFQHASRRGTRPPARPPRRARPARQRQAPRKNRRPPTTRDRVPTR